jgi:hypothetical protein
METKFVDGMARDEYRIMNFEVDGERLEVECRLVDLKKPEYDAKFENAPLYRKNAEVQARQVTTIEEVRTALDATTSTAEPGDWIVTNPGGETYRVVDEIFNNAYRSIDGKVGFFESIGVPVKVVEVTENIAFMAPWASLQGVRAGGYVVERTDNGERYGIDKAAFEATYVAMQG